MNVSWDVGMLPTSLHTCSLPASVCDCGDNVCIQCKSLTNRNVDSSVFYLMSTDKLVSFQGFLSSAELSLSSPVTSSLKADLILTTKLLSIMSFSAAESSFFRLFF